MIRDMENILLEISADTSKVIGTEDILGAVVLSLLISGLSIPISIAIGFPIGSLVALRNFRGKGTVITTINSLMGIPPILVGLLVYLLLSRSGPLGLLNLLFTPEAMIIAQVIIVTPIIIGLTQSSVSGVDRRIRDLALSLGASQNQLILTSLKEARTGIIAAVVAGFGRAISEVGAVLMVGGGIRFLTRNITVGIFLSVELGDFVLALTLGFILLIISFIVNLFFTKLQGGVLR